MSRVSIRSAFVDPTKRYMNGASKVVHRFSRRTNVVLLYWCIWSGDCGFLTQSGEPSFQRTSIDPGAVWHDPEGQVSATARASTTKSAGRLSSRLPMTLSVSPGISYKVSLRECSIEPSRHEGTDNARRGPHAQYEHATGTAARSVVMFGLSESPPSLPGRIRTLIDPVGHLFVVYLSFAEQPLPFHFHQLIFVVPKRIQSRSSLRIVVAVVKPIGSASRLVAVDLNDDVRNVVPPRCGTKSRTVLCRPVRIAFGHARDHFPDRIPAFHHRSVIQHSIFGERGCVRIGIAKVQREHVARLQILDFSPIVGIT